MSGVSIFTLVLAYIAVIYTFWTVVLVLSLKNPDGKISRSLKELRSKPYAEAYKEAHTEIASRLPLGIALMLLVVTQIKIASLSLSESAARKMATVFSVAGLEFGPFWVAGILIIWWILEPKIRYVSARIGDNLGIYTPAWAEKDEKTETLQ